MRIAVVDDDKNDVDTLQQYLKTYSQKKGEKFDIAVFNDGLAFIGNYKPVYDLVFMDIMMPKLNGLEASKVLYRIDKHVGIVFLTNMEKYAVKGYDVGAIDFLIKPIDYYTFESKLSRILRRLDSKREEFKLVNTEDGITKLSLAGICFVETEKHYLYYHTDDGRVIRERGAIGVLEAQLQGNGFCLANSGTLVNLRSVSDILRSTVCLKNGETITLSRSKRKIFMETFTQYIGGLT